MNRTFQLLLFHDLFAFMFLKAGTWSREIRRVAETGGIRTKSFNNRGGGISSEELYFLSVYCYGALLQPTLSLRIFPFDKLFLSQFHILCQ